MRKTGWNHGCGSRAPAAIDMENRVTDHAFQRESLMRFTPRIHRLSHGTRALKRCLWGVVFGTMLSSITGCTSCQSSEQDPPAARDMGGRDLSTLDDMRDPRDMSNSEREDAPPELEDMRQDQTWHLVTEDWAGAILSVTEGPDQSVWAVGAQAQGHPTLLEWNADQWRDHELDFEGDLWWAHGFEQGPLFVGGSYGAVFRYDGGDFERMDTPALARHTVFGIWGQAPDDLYAVGGIGTRDGFVWHYDGESWSQLRMPSNLPKLENTATPALFKVWGDGQGTVWFVGARGLVLRRQDQGPLELIPTPTEETLLTVHGTGTRAWAVGGSARGVILELGEEVVDVSPPGAQLFQGVYVTPSSGWAVGGLGQIYQREGAQWEQVVPDTDLLVESLHAVTVDARGRLWAVGGNAISPALDRGAILTRGPEALTGRLPERISPEPEPTICPPEVLMRGADKSVARRWIEQNLAAIRLEIPEPGVHARNLFHVSLALFDAWAAFDPLQEGLVVQEPTRQSSAQDRRIAMSHAAFGVLMHRYQDSVGGERSSACFRAVMQQLGLDPRDRSTQGPSPAALGNRIAQQIIERYQDDGALESLNYQDSDYMYRNPPLVVDEPGTNGVDDPERWQPLDIAKAQTQNGIPLEQSVQGYIGPHWGDVTPFALERPAPDQPYFEGELPELGPQMESWVIEVIQKTTWLDTRDGELVDISPGAYGNNPLGTNDGQGHPLNPATGLPYPAQRVPRGDFGRVVAEYWADGPDSETPPGHWNTIAHRAFDHPDFERRFLGQGEPVDELTWDVHAYVALNGALHDAAIAAWELKRNFESSRPITLIRWMAARGQSSDPQEPSYDPAGLPLIDGLIEVVTQASAAPGQRHEHLAAYQGEVVIRSWPGAPGDLEGESSAATWIRGVMWVPYQPRNFVSPAFPGYVSGHSTFSRAAAEVLTELTGSAYFPGGMGEFVARENEYLEFEQGPSTEVRLQWATYRDAADQSGQSRIWGGIHIEPDDFRGRVVGERVGQRAMLHVMELIERF